MTTTIIAVAVIVAAVLVFLVGVIMALAENLSEARDANVGLCEEREAFLAELEALRGVIGADGRIGGRDE